MNGIPFLPSRSPGDPARRFSAAKAAALLLALAAGNSTAQDLVVDGTALTIDADRTVAGSVLVSNGGTLTLRGARLTLSLAYDEEQRIEVSGGSRLVVEDGVITSTGGQYWIELNGDATGAPSLVVRGSSSWLTNHSGIRPSGAARIEVTGGDVEELQVADEAVATVANAFVYPVFFFTEGKAVIDRLDTGTGISASVSVPGGWSFTLTNATVGGYQLDLMPGADVTLSHGDGIVASFHTPGSLGADERVVEGITSSSRTSGSVTSLGSRFVFTDTNVALVNVYTFGTDRVLLRNLHVNEVNAEGESRLTIGQPGTTTRLNCNLCQVYDRATFVVDGVTIDASGNLPSATASYHDQLPAPGRGVMLFRNVDLRAVDLTALEEGTIRLCGCQVDPARVKVIDPGARIETLTDPGCSSQTREDQAERIVAPAAPASAQNAAFSPSGRDLLFTLFEGGYNLGTAGLHLKPFPAGETTQLFREPDQAAVDLPGSAWSSATGRIVFASDREERDEIWTMRSDATDLFRVTRGVGGGSSIEGSFSPDGAWIAFESAGGAGEARQGSLYVVRADGTGLVRLTDGPGGATDDRQPAWSPRGDRILFQRRAAGSTDWDLATIPATGGTPALLTHDSSIDTDPGWSPDGRFVVFSSDEGGLTSPNVFVVPATGGTPVRATRAAADDAAPSFSPDGRWIAFESHADGEAPASIWRIASPVAAAPPLVVPIVLDVETGTARYTTELFLTNHGAAPVDLRLTYTAALGSAQGSGSVTERLSAGEQRRMTDALSTLREKGLSIPLVSQGPSQGGTLAVEVLTAGAAVTATARTTTATRPPQPAGRAGLAYSAVPFPQGIPSRALVLGLRSTATDRSNLALFNVASDLVTVRVTAHSGAGDGASAVLEPALVLPAYGWKQLDGVLTRAGMTNGWVAVERVSATGRFGAYGVVNDNGTNDGSFLLPAWGDRSGPAIVVPVLVETPRYTSELVLTNTGASPATLALRYVESLAPALGAGGSVTVTLGAGEQRILPDAIDFLRRGGAVIGAAGTASYAGSLRVTATAGTIAEVFASARTSAASPSGGWFGLFTPGLTNADLATSGAWLDGLVADGESRSNVAVLHAGAPGSGSIVLDLTAHDGSTGAAKSPVRVTLNPGEWRQFQGFLATLGVSNGTVRVQRVSGSAPWAAYGVVNDGTAPDQGTSDGAWVPMAPE